MVYSEENKEEFMNPIKTIEASLRVQSVVMREALIVKKMILKDGAPIEALFRHYRVPLKNWVSAKAELKSELGKQLKHSVMKVTIDAMVYDEIMENPESKFRDSINAWLYTIIKKNGGDICITD